MPRVSVAGSCRQRTPCSVRRSERLGGVHLIQSPTGQLLTQQEQGATTLGGSQTYRYAKVLLDVAEYVDSACVGVKGYDKLKP